MDVAVTVARRQLHAARHYLVLSAASRTDFTVGFELDPTLHVDWINRRVRRRNVKGTEKLLLYVDFPAESVPSRATLIKDINLLATLEECVSCFFAIVRLSNCVMYYTENVVDTQSPLYMWQLHLIASMAEIDGEAAPCPASVSDAIREYCKKTARKSVNVLGVECVSCTYPNTHQAEAIAARIAEMYEERKTVERASRATPETTALTIDMSNLTMENVERWKREIVT